MNSDIATRNMVFRRRTADGLGTPMPMLVSIGPVEPYEPSSSFRAYRCVVTTGPSPLVPNEVFSGDPISTLIAAVGAADSFCQMLNHLGELLLPHGGHYEPTVDGIEGLAKHARPKGFFPDFGTK